MSVNLHNKNLRLDSRWHLEQWQDGNVRFFSEPEMDKPGEEGDIIMIMCLRIREKSLNYSTTLTRHHNNIRTYCGVNANIFEQNYSMGWVGFEPVKLSISLPVCNTLFISHLSSSKIFISLPWNIFFVSKLDPKVGLIYDPTKRCTVPKKCGAVKDKIFTAFLSRRGVARLSAAQLAV